MTHGLVHLRVTDFADLTSVIRTFRAATNYSVREIRAALNAREPLGVAQLFTSGHDESEASLRALLQGLDRIGATVEILLDHEIETRQILENALEQWEEIGAQIEFESDLESGQPSIESLMELKRQYDPEAFLVTLNQILNSEGYNVDEETMEWVRHELRKVFEETSKPN